MSFSVISIPAPITASAQAQNTILANGPDGSSNGSYIKSVILNSSGALSYRNVNMALGELSTAAVNAVQIALTANTPTVISLTAISLNALSQNFDQPTQSRLRYTGSDTVVGSIRVVLGCYSTVNNQQFLFTIYRNGVSIGTTTTSENLGNGVSTNVSIQGIFTMNTNDYFEVYATNLTANNPILVQYFNMQGFVSWM